ncbi:MAG: PorT family protein [Dysgonamonadaceae bacterium]|jgi:hypothetical protein|nr:PorT family protein [Dysgonamonadaceae bacterium]
MKTTDKWTETDNFSRIIRDKLKDYSLPIEAGSWEELEKRLNTQSKKKILLWPGISGISVAASIAGVVLFLYHPKNLYYDNTTFVPHHAEGITENVLAEENLSSACLSGVQTQPALQGPGRNETPGLELAFHEPDVTVAEQTAPEDTKSTVKEEINQKETPSSKSDKPRIAEDWQDEKPLIPSKKSKKRSGSLDFHISSGGGLYASNNQLNTVNSEYASALRSNKFALNAPAPLSNDILGPDDFGKISHLPPISVGLSVRKSLTEYLSIESGLTYTYLYSTFENKVPQRDARLTLHYLGIPVNLVVDWSPHSHSLWNLYLSAGGMVEKGLLAHYVQTTHTAGSDVEVNTNISNEKIQGLQWSVQAALGVSYRFHRNYSLFLEPKASYYLDNNQPFNVRTEHPFVPGINIGLRHTW